MAQAVITTYRYEHVVYCSTQNHPSLARTPRARKGGWGVGRKRPVGTTREYKRVRALGDFDGTIRIRRPMPWCPLRNKKWKATILATSLCVA